MAGKTQLDADTARENRRVVAQQVQPDPLAEKIDATFGAVPTQAAPGAVVPSRAIAEYQIEKYGTGLTKQEKATVADLKKTSWATAEPWQQQIALNAMPSALMPAGGSNFTKTFVKYPGLALAVTRAAGNSTLEPRQLRAISNATEILDTTLTILSMRSKTQIARAINSLPPARQAAVLKAGFDLQEVFAQAQRGAEAAMARSDAAQAGRPLPLKILGVGLDGLLTGFNWLSDNSVHAGRTMLNTWQTGHDPIESWHETASGQFSVDVDKLGADYGADRVAVMKDIVRAMHHDPGYSISDFIVKYGNNDAALSMLDMIQTDDSLLEDFVRGDAEKQGLNEIDTKARVAEAMQQVKDTRELFAHVSSERIDSFGNLVLNKGLDTMPGRGMVTGAFDIGAMFVLDPTLAAGKAYKGYQAFRYGLRTTQDLGDLTKVFTTPKVARFFDELDGDILRHNAAGGGERETVRLEIKKKYGKYLNDGAIESLIQHSAAGNRLSGKTFVREWVQEMDGLEKLLSGSTARRIEHVTAPKMGAFQAKRVDAYLKVRNSIQMDEKSNGFINALFGYIDDPQIRAAAKDLGFTKDMNTEEIANRLQDLTVQNTLAQEFGIQPSVFGRMFRDLNTGRGTSRLRRNADLFLGKLEKMPTGGAIKTSDASDAEKFRLLARAGGLSPYAANFLTDTWRLASGSGERRLLLNGLMESIAVIKHIDLERFIPELGMTVRDAVLATGSKTNEMYATTQGAFKALQTVDELASWSARVSRAILPKLDDAAQKRIKLINSKLYDMVEEQKELKAELELLQEGFDDAVLAQADDLSGRMQDLADALQAEMDDLQKRIGRGWGRVKGFTAEREKLKAEGGIVLYNPAEVMGKQHALHLDQMTDHASIPDFRIIQMFQARHGILDRILGFSQQQWAAKIVDMWSGINLASPRYIERNAAEDWAGYFLTGGALRDAMAGRMASTVVRELRGRKLGVGLESSRRIAESNRALGKWMLSHLDEVDVRAFDAAVKARDIETIEKMSARAIMRAQATTLGGALDDVASEAIVLASSRDDAYRVIDHVAEVRGDVGGGGAAALGRDGAEPAFRKTVADLHSQKRLIAAQSDFKVDNVDTYMAWHRKLESILHNDKGLGQITFNAMKWADANMMAGGRITAARERAVPKLIAYLSDPDKSSEWFAKSSMLHVLVKERGYDAGIAEFARRYFDDAASYLSKADEAGAFTTNSELIKALTRTNEKTGATFGAMYLTDDAGKIEWATNFDIDALRKFDYRNRPSRILVMAPSEVGGTNKITLMEKTFGALGESLARISREPIFFANYIREYRGMQPLVAYYRDTLQMTEQAAKRHVADIAFRRAEEFTVNYIDNPHIRTQLAFNVRNVARYYRATEDFYRRSMRIVKYSPEAIQKLNLTYKAMESSGFAYTDDQGQQYFVYPGTGVVNRAVWKVLQASPFGMGLHITNPFVMAGQTLMLTPSSDPESVLPTFSGPLAAVPIKAFTVFGGDWFEKLALGSRGYQPTSTLQSFGDELKRAIMPAPLLRMLDVMDRGDKDTMFASAYQAAAKYADYTGILDQRDGEEPGAYAVRVKSAMTNMSVAVLGMRFLMGFTAPASPSALSGDGLTADARKMGIKSLRREYLELLNKHDGNADIAMGEFFKLTHGKGLPYTVSSTITNTVGYPSLTSESGKWLTANADFVSKHYDAAPFLTPSIGDFSFTTYSLAKSLGFIQGQANDDAFLKIITANDYYKYTQLKDYADKAIAAAPTVEDRKRIREQMANAKSMLAAENPYLLSRIGPGAANTSDDAKTKALDSVRNAIGEIYTQRKSMVTPSTDIIKNMLALYDYGMEQVGRFQSQSNYDTDQRQLQKSNLSAKLKTLAGEDANALAFFDRVLSPLVGADI